MSSSRKKLFPLVSADVALFSIERERLRVLLVQRANVPEQGRWALPGGVLKPDVDASLEDTARRIADGPFHDIHVAARERLGKKPIESAPVVSGDTVYVEDAGGRIGAYRTQ